MAGNSGRNRKRIYAKTDLALVNSATLGRYSALRIRKFF